MVKAEVGKSKGVQPATQTQGAAWKERLPCVTLHRPWGYAVTDLGKPVENRNWPCFLAVGQLIAIHNGQKWDKEALEWIHRLDSRFDLLRPESSYPAQHVIAIARFAGNVTESESPWFSGPIGWQLEDVVKIEPIACPGSQRIWYLTGDLLNQVKSNYVQALALKS